MRKLINIFVLTIVMISAAVSCKCTQDKKEANTTEGTPATVEDLIALDRQAMFMNHANDYRWYETGIQLKDFLDEENDGAIDMVVNVFQVIEKYSDTCFDTFVYKYQHFADGTVKEDSVHGFWVEDYPLENEVIKVTFKEAYEKVMAVNLPKPHTRQVVLRKEIGPKECNPQWIFGNLRSQIYVDAVTGEVSDKSPAFSGLNIGTPLGEWP